MIKRISIDIVEYVAHTLAVETMSWDEPIPDFGTRYPNILESCISAPFQEYEGKELYKGLTAKAAILFYLMIKNHPFQNGNKRIAVTTLFLFLLLNKKWIKVDNTELYNFSVWVAESNSKLKREVTLGIEKFIKVYLVDSKK
ncbi:MAG: type II toxin-antitoxin system death-on-curing family toxin [Candidatus Portnoybacteria bacterium]